MQDDRPTLGGTDGTPVPPGFEDPTVTPPSLQGVVHNVFRLYSTENTHDFLATLRSCYAPNATFVDNLVVAHPRSSMELQFYALHKIFSQASVEVGEMKSGPVEDGYYAGLWQVTVQNTQQYRFSRTTKISQQVLPDDVRLEVTTTLTIDPQSKQVVRHEDEWNNVGPELPMLWRRLNAGITNAVFRWLGWRKELQLQAARQAPSYGGVD